LALGFDAAEPGTTFSGYPAEAALDRRQRPDLTVEPMGMEDAVEIKRLVRMLGNLGPKTPLDSPGEFGPLPNILSPIGSLLRHMVAT
jgi:hypothetical protein